MSAKNAAIVIKARWARRRATWGDHYCIQVWLPSGQTCSCGAGTPDAALAGVTQWAEWMIGGPVTLDIVNRQPR